MARQTERLASGFQALNDAVDIAKPLDTDGQIRVVCLIDWILLRQRYDLSPYSNLIAIITQANTHPIFTSTDPRQE